MKPRIKPGFSIAVAVIVSLVVFVGAIMALSMQSRPKVRTGPAPPGKPYEQVEIGNLLEEGMDIEQVVDALDLTHVVDLAMGSVFRPIYICSSRKLPGKVVVLRLSATQKNMQLISWQIEDGDLARDWGNEVMKEVDSKWARDMNLLLIDMDSRSEDVPNSVIFE